eukprot:CAMPEP_0119115806 /NCGR_PEP_ID=MMETSP1180-20130426/51941_1 /TAXON_ID=3052 ORGANISM="Chlamydomonas cf sp, Strain CCMP681" /NCGR_SAMPLE_ID=MMETSP1180 /ASSEMBLY_ACC=CAM_ASM_000741 /LENGTH=264 /DNA_ID=CAMNT_0007104899 /DNA_START=66 /DNA_END=860 /DNA_ORIENTATION=+
MTDMAAIGSTPERCELLLIGAGFPRTGTLSIRTAIEAKLGPCHHMRVAFEKNELATWARLSERGWASQKEEVLQLLSPYAATIDAPTMMSWKNLFKTFPNAKVLLSVRDSFDQWHQSVLTTVYLRYKNSRGDPKLQRKTMDSMFGSKGIFQGRFEDKEFARKIYTDFIEDVKRTVPASQLLIYNVKEGWGPLCKLLNVPVPENEPFPRVNDAAEFHVNGARVEAKYFAKMNKRLRTGAAAVAGLVVAVGLGLLLRSKPKVKAKV